MRRQLVAICGAMLLALTGGRVVAALSQPVWIEVPWPFPIDQWGRGKAYACKAADCGTAAALADRSSQAIDRAASDEQMRDRYLVGAAMLAVGAATVIAFRRGEE